MKRRYIILTAVLILAPVCFAIYKYIKKFDPTVLSESKAGWEAFGDSVGGVINPYISLLTLIATTYIAYTFYIYGSKRDEQNKDESNVKSFIELYQFFISNQLREARATA